MSEIEKAIAYFEDAVKESDEIIGDCSEALQAELTEQKQHFAVALDTLREKAEREKGCEFVVNGDMFGEYCNILTDYSHANHIYKIVSHFKSNAYCEVPILYSTKETSHNEVIDVLNVIHCGIDETKVIRVALKDVELRGRKLEADK
jgi:hypothetical protein